jgi:hypothetical protein
MASYQAQLVTFGRAFMNTVMAALKTVPAGPLVTTAKLRLFNGPSFTPTPGMEIADLVAIECAYSGYVAGGVAVVLTAPVNLTATAQGVLFTTLFEATAATPFVPDVAWGWWIDDGTNVVAAEKFGNGFSAGFAAPGSFLNLTAVLPGQLNQAAV